MGKTLQAFCPETSLQDWRADNFLHLVGIPPIGIPTEDLSPSALPLPRAAFPVRIQAFVQAGRCGSAGATIDATVTCREILLEAVNERA